MKKLIVSLLSLCFSFGAGNFFQTVYLTPTVTTNYTKATVKLLGSNGSISANSILVGTITANRFVGSGAALTNVPVSSNVVTRNYSQGLSVNGTISASTFIGNGSQLTGLGLSTNVVTNNYLDRVIIGTGISTSINGATTIIQGTGASSASSGGAAGGVSINGGARTNGQGTGGGISLTSGSGFSAGDINIYATGGSAAGRITLETGNGGSGGGITLKTGSTGTIVLDSESTIYASNNLQVNGVMTAESIAVSNGNISANYFIGNGSLLTGVIADNTGVSNRTVFVDIVASNNVWSGLTSIGNDLYACVDGGSIWKSTAGGPFVDLVAGNKAWSGITSVGNDVYASVYGGSIWKSTAGGPFVDLVVGTQNWSGMTTLGAFPYACIYGGSIWLAVDGTWMDYGIDAKNWNGITSVGGFLTGVVDGGSIWVYQYGNLIDLSAPVKNWSGITAVGSDTYACEYGGSIWKSTAGGAFTDLDTGYKNWNAMTTISTNAYACVSSGSVFVTTTTTDIRAYNVYADGSVIATELVGDGSRITNLTYANNVVTNSYSGGISVSGTITANNLVGDGSRITGLIAYINTANADLRYYPITGVIGILTENADLRYLSISGTANNALTANYAVNAGTLDGQHGTFYQPASTAVTNNYSGMVTIGTVSASAFIGTVRTSEQPSINSVGTLTGLTVNTLIYAGGTNVGIGITPTTKLSVAGTVSASALQVNGAITGTGTNSLATSNFTGPLGVHTSVGSLYIGHGLGSNTGANVAVGSGNPLGANTAGYYNTALGHSTLLVNTDGINNTAVGSSAGVSLRSGLGNTLVGARVFLMTTTANRNVIVGTEAASQLKQGNENTLIGDGVGDYYGTSNINSNTGVGHKALSYHTAGGGNTAIGHKAAGTYPGYVASGISNGVYIGAGSDWLNQDETNAIAIGYGTESLGSNTMVLGNASTITTNIRGTKVGIGTAAPSTTLEVAGTISANAINLTALPAANETALYVSATGVVSKATSSRRYKTHIEPLDVDSELIYQIEPKSWNYKSYTTKEVAELVDGETISKNIIVEGVGQRNIGAIAEDVAAVLPQLVNYSGNLPESLKDSQFIWLMLEELKKLRARIEELEAR